MRSDDAAGNYRAENGYSYFAIDDNRMRAIAEKPILIWQGKNQRILEFTYDEDVVFRLRDYAYAEIKLHFER